MKLESILAKKIEKAERVPAGARAGAGAAPSPVALVIAQISVVSDGYCKYSI